MGRIILFTALMLVAGVLLTYVTFIRDSGKKPADSVKSATAGTGKNDSLPSESSGTGSGGSLTDSASKETVEDISTEDLSVYLSEMPAEGTEIVSTAEETSPEPVAVATVPFRCRRKLLSAERSAVTPERSNCVSFVQSVSGTTPGDPADGVSEQHWITIRSEFPSGIEGLLSGSPAPFSSYHSKFIVFK